MPMYKHLLLSYLMAAAPQAVEKAEEQPPIEEQGDGWFDEQRVLREMQWNREWYDEDERARKEWEEYEKEEEQRRWEYELDQQQRKEEQERREREEWHKELRRQRELREEEERRRRSKKH
ncbi:MAG: hypothetical protein H7A37_00810 [Chlamydiales bacterium]|nr:hypothetical protein [Chlamydiia bacterium]MCP5506833.1 hypothetical protein [Chlamydiales bacterium]